MCMQVTACRAMDVEGCAGIQTGGKRWATRYFASLLACLLAVGFNIRRHSFGIIVSCPKVAFNDSTSRDHDLLGTDTRTQRRPALQTCRGNISDLLN